MAKKREIKVGLIFDDKGAVTAIRTAENELLDLKKAANETEEATKGLSNRMKLGLAAALVGVASAARSGIRVLKESTELAKTQEIAERKLEQALRNTGDASKESAEKLKALASETQRATNFSDEMIVTAQAMLLSFGEVSGAEGAALLTPRLADVAAGVQKVKGEAVDLNTIAAALGKSVSGGAGSLKEYGISLTTVQEEAFNSLEGLEKVRLLTEILDSNFAGLAAATQDAGIQMSNAVGDIKESLGKALRPEIESLQRDLTAFLQDERTIAFAEKIGGAIVSIGRGIIRFFQYSIPISINRLNAFLGNATADLVEIAGKAAFAILNPIDAARNLALGIGLGNSFSGLTGTLRSGAAASSAQVDALLNQELEQSAERIKQQTFASQNFSVAGAVSSTTGGGGSGGGRKSPRVEFRKAEAAELAQTEKKLADDIGAAVIAQSEARINAVAAQIDAEKALKAAQEETAISAIAQRDASITSFADVARAAAEAARSIIQAQLAQLIAGSLPKLPFPANLVVWPIAAAASNLLVNTLIPQFATGVTGFGGGLALVGERGPELVNLPSQSNVITNENTERLLQSINGTVSGSNDFGGAVMQLAESNQRAFIELGDRIEQMQVQIDYFGLTDGLNRHNKKQRFLGNTAR